eukprot:184625-Pyramimonas_sp.AAC.1
MMEDMEEWVEVDDMTTPVCEGELRNAGIVSAASLAPHTQGRQGRRPKKPEDLWRMEEDMKQLRSERRWEDCKQLRRQYRPAKRRYHAELVRFQFAREGR